MVRDETPKTVYWLDNNLYLNITNKCPNRCIFCIRNFKKGVGDFTLKLNKEPSFEEIKQELEASISRKTWKEIVFCGFGEPTARLDLLLELARWIKKRCKSISVRVNTNGLGYSLYPGRDVVTELRSAGVDKVSVSLNASDEETYSQICQPTTKDAFRSILNFIAKAKQILEVDVTAVTTPEVEIYKVEALAKVIGVKFRLRPCIPCFW